MRHKVVENAHNNNQAFGQGTMNKSLEGEC